MKCGYKLVATDLLLQVPFFFQNPGLGIIIIRYHSKFLNSKGRGHVTLCCRTMHSKIMAVSVCNYFWTSRILSHPFLNILNSKIRMNMQLAWPEIGTSVIKT